MMVTDRLALPLLASGQAQKEITHNEALALLDLAVQPVVEAMGIDAPPADPLPGQAWITGDAPFGGWAGRARAIAGWTAGGWRFLSPREGWSAWVRTSGVAARFDGTAWIVVAPQPAIAAPEGGEIADAEARSAIASLISVLEAHGMIAAAP